MGVDRISQGPLNTAGTNPLDSPGALVADQQNGILAVTTNTKKLQACQVALTVLPAQTALVTVTTAQNLISLAIPAGALNVVGRTFEISGSIIYTTPGTTTPTMTLALVLGGVTLCSITTAALSATASTNMPAQFYFIATVVSVGASATIESHGYISANISANTPAAAATQYLDTNTAVSSAVNLLNAANLQVQVSASSAISSIQLRQGILEIAA